MTPGMTPERWHEIKQLVNAARQADSQARTAILQQSCTDDFALRIGAEALLSKTRPLPATPLAPADWQRVEQLFQATLEGAGALWHSDDGCNVFGDATDRAGTRHHESVRMVCEQRIAGGGRVVGTGAVCVSHGAGRAEAVFRKAVGRVNVRY